MQLSGNPSANETYECSRRNVQSEVGKRSIASYRHLTKVGVEVLRDLLCKVVAWLDLECLNNDCHKVVVKAKIYGLALIYAHRSGKP
ncbi:unnamed protein product [Toxocara canis]|uniref:Transposase n=1 Tax=Toxocara canis TaxID=6265 RepID=A0A183UQD9_TOXCA|nr:unnamed protein product [Toxocara canis]